MKAKKPYTFCLILLISVVMALPSCKVTKNYSTPEINTEGLFRDRDLSDTTSFAALHWKEVFTDSLLQDLIARGVERNLDLQIAFARVRQAEQYYQQSRAGLHPNLAANLSVTESRLSEAQGFGIRTEMRQFNIGLSSSWEADIWGKLSSLKRSNLALMLASNAGAQAVQSRLVSNIASLYYNLVALDGQLNISQHTVLNWDSTVVTMEKLKLASRVTEAAVAQSKAQRHAVAVTIPDLKQRIRETENALKILLGTDPGPVRRSSLSTLPSINRFSTGLPGMLLANRPDVRQAEYRYRSTFELSNAARASFYPNLNITASAGLNSLSLEKLLNPTSLAASIMGGLTQPIFNRRLLRTNHNIAKEEQLAASLNYQNILLQAGREVSDALYMHSAALEKTAIRKAQITEWERSVVFTQRLLASGFADYLELITARQNLLSAEIGQVQDHLQELQSTVSLYQALGGGWR